MTDINEIKKVLEAKSSLSKDQAFDLQSLILQGKVPTSNLVQVFELLDSKGKITLDELKGFFEASKEAMVRVENSSESLDTCGTGGGGQSTFNISTAAAIVCATAGIPVAKHGNRAATSLCGSADVLESLRVRIDLNPQEVTESITKHNFAFMFARAYHPAFKHVGDARKQFGKKTYFNLLGPLLNPASAVYRVHGFSDPAYMELLGQVLIESGVKKAILVHSQDNMDEISPFAPTDIIDFSSGSEPKRAVINPADYGFGKGKVQDIQGGTAQENADIIRNVFEGKANSSQTEAVVLNAAAGLLVFGKVKDLGEGINIAKETISSGKALEKLNELSS